MPRKKLKTFVAATRDQWRDWLEAHHGSETEVWLVFYKRQTARASVSYDHAVEEALCFGWIDSIVKRVDEVRYLRKFTPRKPGSMWSASNRRRYAELKAQERLAPAGLRRSPTARNYDKQPPPPKAVPRYIQQGLRADRAAWNTFERLAPSYRRAYIGWIDCAKREETRARRLREVVGLLRAGKKLGLK
jgi:uncharacterized protein YdeI (YjbR/CyaY-like superfamily)